MADGEIVFNDRTTALLFGVSPEALESYASRQGGRLAYNIPPVVTANSRVRLDDYMRITGTEGDPDIWKALEYWARLEGVELVFVNAAGDRTVIVAGRPT